MIRFCTILHSNGQFLTNSRASKLDRNPINRLSLIHKGVYSTFKCYNLNSKNHETNKRINKNILSKRACTNLHLTVWPYLVYFRVFPEV